MSRITPQDLTNFVYNEALLLDNAQYDEWLDLFADDGFYWMPLSSGQTDPLLHNSLLYEDKLLLKIRIERLHGQRTFSQQPQSRCHHLLQAPQLVNSSPEKEAYVLRTAFHYTETREDKQQIYVGWQTHHLCVHERKLKIKLKRVDLVNPEAPFGNIQLFM